MLLLTICTMLVPGIYWLGIEKYFLYPGVLSILAQALFVGMNFIGLTYAVLNYRDDEAIALAIALSSPIVHFWYFQLLRRLFIARMKREPVDVAINFNSGLMPDRIFAFSFVLGAIFSSMSLVYIFLYRASQ